MLLSCICSGQREKGGSPSVFSNKRKLKLKPIKDSSVGILSRTLQPAGNELLAACATKQGDKTSFSASGAGRWHWLCSLSSLWGGGGGPKGRRDRAGHSAMPWACVTPLVPSMHFTSDDGQGLVVKGMMMSKEHVLLTQCCCAASRLPAASQVS